MALEFGTLTADPGLAADEESSVSLPLNILLVDDNDELRDAAGELLREMGYRVATASRGAEALEIFARRASEEPFDLLVSDVFMPGMSGLELVGEVLEIDRDLAVLLISSHVDDLALRRRLREGDVAFLAKPFSAEDLETRVAEALDLMALRAQRGSQPAGEASAEVASVPVAIPTPPRTAGRGRRWALAAMVTLVAGLGAARLQLDWGAPHLPARAVESVRRGVSVEALAPVGQVAEAPETLRWLEVEGADRYKIELRGVDLAVVWRSESEQGHAELPAGVVAEMHAAVTYFWSVQAFDGDRLLAGSGPVQFTIEPERRQLDRAQQNQPRQDPSQHAQPQQDQDDA